MYENDRDTDSQNSEIIEFVWDRRLSKRLNAGNYIKVIAEDSIEISLY